MSQRGSCCNPKPNLYPSPVHEELSTVTNQIVTVWTFAVQCQSQQRFKMLVNVCLDGIFWITEHFVPKLGMVMQHYEPECYAEKSVHCLQCQGHSEGLYNQSVPISAISSKLLVCLQPSFLIVQHHKRECSMEKLNYCIQGQGHSKGSKCQWMFVCMTSSELPNILLPNLVWC